MAERKIYFHTRYIGGGWSCTVLETVDDGSDNLRPLANFNLTCNLTLYGKAAQDSVDRRGQPKYPFLNECLSRIVDAIKKQPELVGGPHDAEDTPY